MGSWIKLERKSGGEAVWLPTPHIADHFSQIDTFLQRWLNQTIDPVSRARSKLEKSATCCEQYQHSKFLFQNFITMFSFNSYDIYQLHQFTYELRCIQVNNFDQIDFQGDLLNTFSAISIKIALASLRKFIANSFVIVPLLTRCLNMASAVNPRSTFPILTCRSTSFRSRLTSFGG